MKGSRSVRFRRSAHLVCYWASGRLVYENYATGARIGGSPLACQILDFFDCWRTVEALFLHLPSFQPASLRKALTALAGHSLLERSDRPGHLKERAMETWKHWNPEAGFLHFSTKDPPLTPDAVAAEWRWLEKARQRPKPSPTKRYPRARQVQLPPPQAAGEFPQVLQARRTWRRFSPRPLDLSDLATLLGLSWAIQKWLTLPGMGRMPLKTFPSGGARHPLELYVLALRVNGLPQGLYHYAADTHQLELLRRGATTRQVQRYLPSQGWYGSASALLLMTAVFGRTQWRYEHARAYRVVLAEAGHACQNLCLTATWLGLAPFCTMAFADSKIEKDLGLDGITESALYVAGVGTRPPGTDWAPWPTRWRVPAGTARLKSAALHAPWPTQAV